MSERVDKNNEGRLWQKVPFPSLSMPLQKTGMIVSEADDIAFHPPQETKFTHAFQSVKGRIAFWLSEEEAYGSRFLFVPAFSGAGAVAYFSLASEPSWIRLLLLAVFFAGIAFLSRRNRVLSLLFVFLLFSVIGALCAKGESARLSTITIGNEISTFVTGRIITMEMTEKGTYRLVLDILATERPVLQHRPARAGLVSRRLPQGAAIGSGLKGLVRLRPPSGPVRPGAYDFSFHHYYRGLGAQGYFMGEPALAVIRAPESWFTRLNLKIARLRHFMTARITAAVPGEAGAVSAALITGQRGGISATTNDVLRISGLAHILSISGLHMAMVTGMVLVAVRLVLGLFPVFSSCHPPKKIAAVIALCAAAFYLVLSGADVAAQRSFVMVAVMLLAVLFDRAAITMRNLAIAALITIAVVPHEILGPSFQMSFAATAALIAAFGWWSERRRHRQEPEIYTNRHSLLIRLVIVPLISTAAASLVAGTASGIFAAFHFNNTAPLGILSNALAFPLMSVVVMPSALSAAILMPLHLDWLPLQVMGAGVIGVQNIALWVASVSPAVNPGAISPSALVMLVIGLVLLIYLRSPLRWGGPLLLCLGLLFYRAAPAPLALISEDRRLAAVIHANGVLAVNTIRPPAFVIGNWKAAFQIKEVIRPQHGNEDAPGHAFVCEYHYCSARLADGKLFTIAVNIQGREKACSNGDIVFLNFIANGAGCLAKTSITPEQLALYGTAEIRAARYGPELVWASGPPTRPWNRHRRFSKTARGIP